MASVIRQNYHENCEAKINKQINMELYASYVYLSLVSACACILSAVTRQSASHVILLLLRIPYLHFDCNSRFFVDYFIVYLLTPNSKLGLLYELFSMMPL